MRSTSQNDPSSNHIDKQDDDKLVVKRNNTYSLGAVEPSPILKTMELQEEKRRQKDIEDSEKVAHAFDDKSSSEDDEEFIRKSMLKSQKKFSSLNADYIKSTILNKISEVDEESHNIEIGKEEVSNGLSVLCDKLNSLSNLVVDKKDRIFTNFD